MSELLLPAFLVTVVLVGIHAYFGLEIIRRGILFTDLAIGQMAALGTALALLFFDGRYLYPSSLALALLSGLIIGLCSRREQNIEPLIGLFYALGVAGVFLLLSRSPHGMEEIQKLMAYDILFTPLSDIASTALLYGLLGGVLWLSRNWQGLRRELVFFLSFAVTVTSSVKLAGVLVVFVLLVAPALMASYLPGQHKLWLAWGLGSGVNLLAVWLSYALDLPTGYTVVCVQALAALLVGIVSLIFQRPLVAPAGPALHIATAAQFKKDRSPYS